MGLLDRWQKKEKSTEATKSAPVQKTDKTEKPKVNEEKSAPKTKEVKKEIKKSGKTASILSNKIILRPVVTEKSAGMEGQNKYSFYVDIRASKFQIKRAIQEVYGVAPIAVNVINVDGKKVRFGRTLGRRSAFKKAVVTLPQGKTITPHEGV